MKKINVNDVIRILEKYPYTKEELNVNDINNKKRFTINAYFNIIEDLLNSFYEYKEVKINIKNDNSKGFQYCSSSAVGKLHKNIIKLEFDLLYPNVLIKLFESGRLQFNIKEFGYLYKFLVDNRLEIKSKTKENTYLLFKTLLNYTYGALFYTTEYADKLGLKKYIYCNNPHLIPAYTKGTFLKLIKNDKRNDKRNIMYIDTDIIYFYEFSIQLSIALNNLDLKYKIEEVNEILFISLKRYIEFKKDKVIKHGISTYKYIRNY